MFNRFLGIIICIIVGNIVLTILESLGMNVWIARLIACIVVGICGVLIYRFEKK